MLNLWSAPYSRVADLDGSDVEKDKYESPPEFPGDEKLKCANSTLPDRPQASRTRVVGVILLLLSTVLIIGQGVKDIFLDWNNYSPLQHQCSKPSLRREWRTLSSTEQQDYVRAAQCFSSLPNPYGSNGTLYDEFSRVHRDTGSLSHESTAFLPWHRYFLHVYEKTLIAECGFRGSVPYWDWSLDSQAFTSSPIWDPDTGFGGNGNTTSGETVGKGKCITDGPFSTLHPVYYNETYNPHCLSRGFGVGNDSEERLRHTFDSVAIEQLLAQETYAAFLTQIEASIHDSLHHVVGGDFRTWTAPNDPIFYLHHAQLDRLWWHWQQLTPSSRLNEYTGRAHAKTTTEASTSDTISMDTLASAVAVQDVMTIQDNLLCYDYT